MPKCFICLKTCESVKQLFCHFDVDHDVNRKSNKPCCCAEPNCVKGFSHLNKFLEHLIKVHQCPKESSQPLRSQRGKKRKNPETSVYEEPHCSTFDKAASPPIVCDNDNLAGEAADVLSNDDIQKLCEDSSVSFIAKLYGNNSLTRSIVQFVVEHCSGMFSSIINALKSKFNSKDIDIDDSDLEDLNAAFTIAENPFKGFETEYKRIKAFKERGTYIKPVPHLLNVRLDEQMRAGNFEINNVKVTEQYIPLPQLLSNFFKQPLVLDKTLAYMNELKQETEVISNVIQGRYWTERFDKFDKIIVPIFFYVDGFQVTNIAGSHSNIHHISGGYVTVPCLPPEFRGTLNNIFVTLLFHSEDRKTYGNEAVFRPLINDLKLLFEKGIVLETETFKGFIYFALANLVGDNLSLHEIIDFSGSFTATYPCRYCKATKAQTEQMYQEILSLLRNELNYGIDVSLNDFSSTGIHCESTWNKAPMFHVSRGTACDLMHDCLEGVCSYVMVLVISHFVSNKRIGLETINNRMKNFDYSLVDSRNKPPLIAPKDLKNNKIRMSSAEMLVFIRFFALIIGDLVPENDPYWALYITLRMLLQLLLAPALQRACSVLMEHLIKCLNESYVKLGGKYLQNKFHHLLHYPRLLLEFGPFVHLWSMRFEGKHRISKRNANVVASQVNVCYTLAVNSQLDFQNYLISGEALQNKITWGAQEFLETETELHNLPKSVRTLPKECMKVSWVEFFGTTYQPNMVLIFDLIENVPAFAKIVDVYVFEGNIIKFKCLQLKITEYNKHFGCYEVEESSSSVLLDQGDLIDPIPTVISKNAVGTKFVTVRHAL